MREMIQRHYRAAVGDYTEQYGSEYAGYPANLKRLDIVLKRVSRRPATLLDCGCGEGSPMLRLSVAGVDVWGFDFEPAMVDRAREILAPRGLSGHVWKGDVTDRSTFRPPQGIAPAEFDYTIAMGVLPHIEDEVGALRNMASVTRAGGRVLVEFRNELFALFTLNRYSYEFFRDELVRVGERMRERPELAHDLESVAESAKRFFRLDVPPARLGDENAPGYDAILSKFRNPFEIAPLFARAGLRSTGLFFYHYHAFPPMFEREHPGAFRELSLEMERDPEDWRGYFMASAFVAEAEKVG